ncbi:hypothetical protein C5748_22340 [Phyllobacterium phragmitis]|uniref:Uncharacterized protein n=1 Tax=Phyllobacterium phragmitis TaxID=2670329 RepID=A0A2S9IL67_9HYPH|nr:hypothetical protein [Phyllobacterium phragmitis]PRD41248.1 hypothetical protein C5748_22340 [Phyllobacterium phragmitis]
MPSSIYEFRISVTLDVTFTARLFVAPLHTHPAVEPSSIPPVEPSAEAFLHLPHQVTGEVAKIVELGGIFRRGDEPELIPVLTPTLD